MEGEIIRVEVPETDEAYLGACRVVGTLRKRGFDAYVVGGAVRDLLMGIRPCEYDIATSATPDEVMQAFKRTIPVGVRYGVVRVRFRGREYEVATYRVDLGYSDGRRPDKVRFSDLREDVLRRDFTMNGLALDPESKEVVDLVGGVADIRAKVIRAIGEARERFAEDRLRPLRAVRFAAQTGFRVESVTWSAMCEAAEDVRCVSVERIRDEIDKMLLAKWPGLGLRVMHESGILRAVLPELANALGEDVEPMARVLDRLAGSGAEVLWGALAWPVGAEGAGSLAQDLHHSRRMAQAMRRIVEAGGAICGLPDPDVAVEKRILRSTWARPALQILEAQVTTMSALGKAEYLDRRDKIGHALERLCGWTREDLFPPRFVTGREAIELGFAPGPVMGKALRALEDAQLRGEVRDREGALHFLRRFVGDVTEGGA